MERDGKMNMTPAGTWVSLSKDGDAASQMTNLSFYYVRSLRFMVFTATPDDYVTSAPRHWFLSNRKQTTARKNNAATTTVRAFGFTL